jgi:two-component system sensor histidine kinase KdpD
VSSRASGVVVAALSVSAITALIYPLRQVSAASSNGVLYLLAVLLVSTVWGLRLGILTSVASALAFNFFHLPPTGQLTIADSDNWVALTTVLLAAVVASSVAALARSRASQAEERRREADAAVAALLAAARERDRLQAELVETEALRRSDELKTALLRATSHDLRTPLTAILTAGSALVEGELSQADRAELGRAIVEEAERLTALVEKLLDLSRLRAGAAEPRPDWVSVDEILREAATVLDPAGERFSLSIDANLPLIRADAVQLERAFANLMENAARYSGSERVSVRARVVGERLMVRVVDRGPGIPAGELTRVFEAFYRGSGDPHTGSGLGLAIVKGFVEANGGRVWAESLPGQGTSFVVALPLEKRPAETVS